METLSRREEEALLKATKVKALKACDPIVKGASLCTALLRSLNLTEPLNSIT